MKWKRFIVIDPFLNVSLTTYDTELAKKHYTEQALRKSRPEVLIFDDKIIID
jgi:hypothetical protein